MNEFIAFRKIPRFNREIIITEKIDGTNAQILISPTNKSDPSALRSIPMLCALGGSGNQVSLMCNVYAGSRSKWITLVNDNHGFAKWVYEHVYDLVCILGIGRFYGEWWGKGIQRGYGLEEKRFSLFNPFFEFKSDPNAFGTPLVYTVPLLAKGSKPSSSGIKLSLDILRETGSQAAPGYMKPEGVVIYHTASGQNFKVTYENDEGGKNEEI